MNLGLEKKLQREFPKLFRGKDKPLTESLMGFGIMCGNGWYGILYDLFRNLSELDEDIELLEVKEKFGTLRVYIINGSDKAYDLIEEAESKSRFVCEVCGKEGKLRSDGWLFTLCDECNTVRINNNIKFKQGLMD